jgi:hypothetical protein
MRDEIKLPCEPRFGDYFQVADNPGVGNDRQAEVYSHKRTNRCQRLSVLYLLFMDELRANLLWVVLAFLSCSAGLMIWAPRLLKGWRRVAVRTIGSVLLGLIVLVSLLGAFFASVDPPREHTWFRSKTGTRIALLSHSEFRDASATQVTVKGDSYWQRYVAYDYFGDGDDYIGPTSIKWLDDHHLAITYALDPSGVQQCHSQAGDVQVICDPQPAPSFSSGSNQR